MQQPAAEKIPYMRDLTSLYKHVNARPPLHKEFDIREIDPDVLKNFDFEARPFRHSFYCLTLFLQGDIELNTDVWKVRLKRPALYFKTPCHIIKGDKEEPRLQEYFIAFTDRFLSDHKLLADIIYGLSFFKLEKAILFEINKNEVKVLKEIFNQILNEYNSGNDDKFEMISSYVYILLLHVRRLSSKYAKTDEFHKFQSPEHDRLLVENFRALIRKEIASGESKNRHLTVKHFAGRLTTHPNHLNAIVKRQAKKTAIEFMHEQILFEAQTLLSQTQLTIKHIASRLGFADSSHFNHFFKKQTGSTPAAYRKEQKL